MSGSIAYAGPMKGKPLPEPRTIPSMSKLLPEILEGDERSVREPERAVSVASRPASISRPAERRRRRRRLDDGSSGSTLSNRQSFRPSSVSTSRHSFSSHLSKCKNKHGTGRYATIELVPQPSDDPEDPLNWPTWRKHLNFLTLLYVSALVGVMKTAYVTVNSKLAISYNVSYTAAVSLTAIPLMISAVTGLASLALAIVWGKRPVYLASFAAMFIGAMWNMRVRESFAQNMAARVFQGVGWAAFDVLVVGSIHDTYFEHQSNAKLLAYNIVTTASTWGAPYLGGVACAGPISFELQAQVISIFMGFGLVLVCLGLPETAYERAQFMFGPPTERLPEPAWTMEKVAAFTHDYLARLKPWSYVASQVNQGVVLRPFRTAFAPTIVLLAIVGMLPYGALWGLIASLSLLFSTLPFMLETQAVGQLVTGPLLMGMAAVGVGFLPLFAKGSRLFVSLLVLAGATGLAAIGLLALGLYIGDSMQLPAPDPDAVQVSLWNLKFVGARISLPVVSFLLSLVAAGSLGLNSTCRYLIAQSTSSTCSRIEENLRNTFQMYGTLACWRNLLAGAFVLGIPNAVWSWDALRSTAIGISVVQLIIAMATCCLWWFGDDIIHRLDGLVVGIVDPRAWEEQLLRHQLKAGHWPD